MIVSYPNPVRANATSRVMFQGAPHCAINWSLVGEGTLSNVDDYTDSDGRAWAMFTPGTADQTVVITVTYGA